METEMEADAGALTAVPPPPQLTILLNTLLGAQKGSVAPSSSRFHLIDLRTQILLQ